MNRWSTVYSRSISFLLKLRRRELYTHIVSHLAGLQHWKQNLQSSCLQLINCRRGSRQLWSLYQQILLRRQAISNCSVFMWTPIDRMSGMKDHVHLHASYVCCYCQSPPLLSSCLCFCVVVRMSAPPPCPVGWHSSQQVGFYLSPVSNSVQVSPSTHFAQVCHGFSLCFLLLCASLPLFWLLSWSSWKSFGRGVTFPNSCF